jgi:hypothetical protein
MRLWYLFFAVFLISCGESVSESEENLSSASLDSSSSIFLSSSGEWTVDDALQDIEVDMRLPGRYGYPVYGSAQTIENIQSVSFEVRDMELGPDILAEVEMGANWSEVKTRLEVAGLPTNKVVFTAKDDADADYEMGVGLRLDENLCVGNYVLWVTVATENEYYQKGYTFEYLDGLEGGDCPTL